MKQEKAWWDNPQQVAAPFRGLAVLCQHVEMPDAQWRQHMSGWVDWDGAEYLLARRLGLVSAEASFQTDLKWIFWTDNPVGNTLADILDALVKIGLLERRDEPDLQFRLVVKLAPNT